MLIRSLYKRNISFIMLFLIASLIFYFSSQTGQESSNLSSVLWVRKLAHISEYTVLSFFVYAYFSNFQYGSKRTIILTYVVSLLYAVSDELHQTFVPNRSGNLIDVGVDSIGIILGIIISIILKKYKI